MALRAKQLELVIRHHGGRRAGAGRKAVGRPGVPHRPRTVHDRHAPVHVTLRAAALPTSLRAPSVFPVVQAALARASRDFFRVVVFSVPRDHVHLLVEADVPAALTRGVQGLAIRVAKRVNRLLGRRGRVWADRFHARDLTSPRAVRHALVYILQNHRKHGHDRGQRVDPCSSARWFTGWKDRVVETMTSPVVAARTWLARVGWRRYGLIDPREVQGGARAGSAVAALRPRPHRQRPAPGASSDGDIRTGRTRSPSARRPFARSRGVRP